MTDSLATRLYELSKHHEFDALRELLGDFAREHSCDFPLSPDDKVKFETSAYVNTAIRKLSQKLESEIAIGKRSSGEEDSGGKHDEYTGTRRRA